MNNFEAIKEMDLKQFAEWLESRNSVCERNTPCSRCKNQDWCDCTEAKDYVKWLEKDYEGI